MQFIDTDQALATACARWADAPVLALDTEFVRVDTYYPRLCLVQVGDGRDPAVIDALAVPSLEPLLDVLYRPTCVKVLHSGSQDLEIFAALRNAPLLPLFDTQRAAELLGDGDQLGYAALVERRFGITVDKSLTRTDWARRPLTPAELEYAATDVTHLFRLYPLLHDELVARGRLAWQEEDGARCADPAHYACPPEHAWQRLKSLPRLPAQAQTAAVALAAWREGVAEHTNRPRRWILPDDALYAIAAKRPETLEALRQIREVAPKTVQRHGTEMLAALATAQPHPAAIASVHALDDAEKGRFNALRTAVGECADALGVPRGLLANRADLESLARVGEAADITLMHGWRRTATREALLPILRRN